MTHLVKSGKWKHVEEECTAYSTHKTLSIVFCASALAFLVPVLLRQLGAIDELPELPGELFDSNRIVMSKMARPLGIPDAILGLGSYSVTMVLLVSATPSRPVVRGILTAKVLLDGTLAARKARGQIKQFGRVCTWCMGTALATAGMVHFARKARVSLKRQRG